MPEFIKIGAKRGWVAEEFRSLFYEDFDLLCEAAQCEIIKNQKRVKVCRLTWQGESLFIKRYNPYSIGNAMEALFFRSKALRAWKGAHLLYSRGINTAEPVAAIEYRRFGVPGKCFYVTKEIIDSEISVQYYEKRFAGKGTIREKRRFIRALARLFSKLHHEGIYHNDLKDYNILVRNDKGEPAFFLLDLEGVRHFKKIPERRLIENLMQINRTIGRIMTNADRVAFIREYCNKEEWKVLSKEVLAASAAKDRKVGAKRL